MATKAIPFQVSIPQEEKKHAGPRPVHQVRSRVAYMDAEQLERFLRAAKEDGPRSWAMFTCGLAHGMRASEISNLKLGDVDFRNGQIRIERLKGSLTTVQTLLKVKGSGLLDERRALSEWLKVRVPDAGQFVFNSQKALKLHRVSIFKIYRRIAEAAGLPPALRHPHCLKHSLGMVLARSNANAFKIRAALGHKSISSTLVYCECTDGDGSAAIAQAFGMGF